MTRVNGCWWRMLFLTTFRLRYSGWVGRHMGRCFQHHMFLLWWWWHSWEMHRVGVIVFLWLVRDRRTWGIVSNRWELHIAILVLLIIIIKFDLLMRYCTCVDWEVDLPLCSQECHIQCFGQLSLEPSSSVGFLCLSWLQQHVSLVLQRVTINMNDSS